MVSYAKSVKRRPKIEYFGEYIIRPLAHVLVVPLARIGFKPHWLVLFHTALGVLAGWQIASSHFVLAAALVAIKTVLDAADGQLARATEQTSVLGRYLDSEGDVLVNLALFVGVAVQTKLWFLSLLAFVVLTIFLSLDFNFEYLFQTARGQVFRPEPHDPKETGVVKILKNIYQVFFGVQDKYIRAFANARFAALTKNKKPDEAALLAYHDETTILYLTNLGLAEQMTILCLCLLLAKPAWFLYWCVVLVVLVVGLQLQREIKLRAHLKRQ